MISHVFKERENLKHEGSLKSYKWNVDKREERELIRWDNSILTVHLSTSIN